MKKKALTLAIAAAFHLSSQAQSSGEATFTLGEITVRESSGGRFSTNSILTSVDIMGGDQVEDKNVMNSWELMGQMPGVQLTETRMGAESGKATFRAFNGEGYINGIKVLIDGVPSNVNSGNQRFIDMVFPLDIDYIEVVRGTNDPRYGLHNIGGNFNMVTRQGGDYTDARLTYGSFNTREAQLALGRESGGFAQNYFIAKQDSDGHRDHSDSEKYVLSGKWFYTSEDGRVKTGLIARAYHHEAEEPGFLTASELAASRTQSPAKNANDGDDRDMNQISLHLDWQLRDDLSLSSKLYRNSYEDGRRVTFTSYPTGNAPRQRRIWAEEQTGLLSTLTWRASPTLTLDAGVNVEHQDNAYQRYRYSYGVPTDFSAAPARTQNDEAYTLDNLGAYLQAIVQASPNFKVIPALRVDRFSGRTRLNTTGETADLQDYGWIPQPKLSLVHSLAADAHVYANWGRTFQILTGSREPAYVTSAQSKAYDPSINTGTELGVKFSPVPQSEVRVAVWQQDATDEVANMPSTGTTVGLGETRRRGVDLQGSVQINRAWRTWASHAIQEARVISGTVDGVSLDGKQVISTPRYISNLGVEYQPNANWRFGLQGRAQDDYYIDNLNAQGKHGGFALFDASLRHALTSTVSLDLQVRNLADRQYEYVWYDNFFWGGADQPMYSPAPGRAVYVSLDIKL